MTEGRLAAVFCLSNSKAPGIFAIKEKNLL